MEGAQSLSARPYPSCLKRDKLAGDKLWDATDGDGEKLLVGW